MCWRHFLHSSVRQTIMWIESKVSCFGLDCSFLLFSAMVNAISELYGNKVDVELDGQVHTFYNFPTLEQLFENRQSMEDGLKLRKFGYRAAWIVKAVEKLTELGGRTWLEELKDRPYKEASETLVKNFTGIGKKVISWLIFMNFILLFRLLTASV